MSAAAQQVPGGQSSNVGQPNNDDGQQEQPIYYPIYVQQYPQMNDAQFSVASDGQQPQGAGQQMAYPMPQQPGVQQFVAQTQPVAYVLAASPSSQPQPIYVPIYESPAPAPRNQFREPESQAPATSSSGDGGRPSSGGSTATPQPKAQLESGKIKDLESGRPVRSGKPEHLNFSNVSVRAGFVRKVFALLTLMLAVVVGMIALFKFEENCNKYVRSHLWPYFLAYAVFFVTYLSIMCCENVRRQSPANLIFLFFLTVSIGYMTAMITVFHNTNVVFMAMAICAFCCFSIILFACQTKYDFTRCIGVAFVLCMVVLFFGFGAIIALIFFKIKFLYMIYSGCIALIFMLYLAIDVQMLIGGKWLEYSPEDYVAVASQLFLDVVYIFIHMLGFSDGLNKSITVVHSWMSIVSVGSEILFLDSNFH